MGLQNEIDALHRIAHAEVSLGGHMPAGVWEFDRFFTIEIDEEDVSMGHEATVSKIGEEQLFYLQSRGLSEHEATLMIVNGFFEPFTKELPMEYAVELNRLLEMEMEGSVG